MWTTRAGVAAGRSIYHKNKIDIFWKEVGDFIRRPGGTNWRETALTQSLGARDIFPLRHAGAHVWVRAQTWEVLSTHFYKSFSFKILFIRDTNSLIETFTWYVVMHLDTSIVFCKTNYWKILPSKFSNTRYFLDVQRTKRLKNNVNVNLLTYKRTRLDKNRKHVKTKYLNTYEANILIQNVQAVVFCAKH